MFLMRKQEHLCRLVALELAQYPACKGLAVGVECLRCLHAHQ
jgi:hypothetical protein